MAHITFSKVRRVPHDGTIGPKLRTQDVFLDGEKIGEIARHIDHTGKVWFYRFDPERDELRTTKVNVTDTGAHDALKFIKGSIYDDVMNMLAKRKPTNDQGPGSSSPDGFDSMAAMAAMGAEAPERKSNMNTLKELIDGFADGTEAARRRLVDENGTADAELSFTQIMTIIAIFNASNQPLERRQRVLMGIDPMVAHWLRSAGLISRVYRDNYEFFVCTDEGAAIAQDAIAKESPDPNGPNTVYSRQPSGPKKDDGQAPPTVDPIDKLEANVDALSKSLAKANEQMRYMAKGITAAADQAASTMGRIASDMASRLDVSPRWCHIRHRDERISVLLRPWSGGGLSADLHVGSVYQTTKAPANNSHSMITAEFGGAEHHRANFGARHNFGHFKARARAKILIEAIAGMHGSEPFISDDPHDVRIKATRASGAFIVSDNTGAARALICDVIDGTDIFLLPGPDGGFIFKWLQYSPYAFHDDRHLAALKYCKDHIKKS